MLANQHYLFILLVYLVYQTAGCLINKCYRMFILCLRYARINVLTRSRTIAHKIHCFCLTCALSPFPQLTGDSHSSSTNQPTSSLSTVDKSAALTAAQRQTELDLAHKLMDDPDELCLGSEAATKMKPKRVQTICAPDNLSKVALDFDKQLYRIDVANTQAETIHTLSGTAVIMSELTMLSFLRTHLDRVIRNRKHLFKQAKEQLVTFINDPNCLLADFERQTSGDNVTFFVNMPVDEDQEVEWEKSSLQLSVGSSSSDTDSDGPGPEELVTLRKNIRKIEGSRFKIKAKKNSEASNTKLHQPPPPNPLGHVRKDVLRTRNTIANGLCRATGNASGGPINDRSRPPPPALPPNSNNNGRGNAKPSKSSTGLFNLVSMTGQISWLISEFLERGSSTYQWANELMNTISGMSVAKTTWFNMHQQLTDITELLYRERSLTEGDLENIGTVKCQLAWKDIQHVYKTTSASAPTVEDNEVTVTAGNARAFLHQEDKLIPLMVLSERKFHLAYVCDLLLYRAHKNLFTSQLNPVFSTTTLQEDQLIDFQIRLLQLRLDRANVQHWSPDVIEWLTCWLQNALRKTDSPKVDLENVKDKFSVNELRTMARSVEHFRTLVADLCAFEFAEDVAPFASANAPSDGGNHHQHHRYHPHMHHHGEGGLRQDLRILDADRCSITCSEPIKQTHEHVNSKRPLRYFAERALYDIALELDVKINWKERLTSLFGELSSAHQEWSTFLQATLGKML